MAWSDAARRAAILARRMKRVQDAPNVPGRDTENRRSFLHAKIGMRLKRIEHYARTRVKPTFHSFKGMMAIERGGSYLPRIMRRR